jgi:hypothetical protein
VDDPTGEGDVSVTEIDAGFPGEQERQVEVEGHRFRLRALPSSSTQGWEATVVGYEALEGARTPERDLPGFESATRDPGRLVGRLRIGGSSPDEALNRLAEEVGDTIAEAVRTDRPGSA